MKDINGKRFGSLVVLERCGKKGSVQLVKCLCDCGNEVVVRYPNLTSGTTTSCGCYKRLQTSKRKMKDLTGKTFGELSVIKRFSDIGSNKILWLCRCSCGHTAVVTGSNLKSGNTTSCGCMKASINESIIIKILRDNNIQYEKEVKYSDLLSPSGNPLRFDFKIFTNDSYFLLEYQGEQHFQSNQWLAKGRFSREYSDKRKKEYCQSKKIELVEITYLQDTKETLYQILKDHNLVHDNTVPSSD